MALFHYSKEKVGISHDGTATEAVYHMGKLVWQAVRSCFGSGHWINEKPWVNGEGWKNE